MDFDKQLIEDAIEWAGNLMQWLNDANDAESTDRALMIDTLAAKAQEDKASEDEIYELIDLAYNHLIYCFDGANYVEVEKYRITAKRLRSALESIKGYLEPIPVFKDITSYIKVHIAVAVDIFQILNMYGDEITFNDLSIAIKENPDYTEELTAIETALREHCEKRGLYSNPGITIAIALDVM